MKSRTRLKAYVRERSRVFLAACGLVGVCAFASTDFGAAGSVEASAARALDAEILVDEASVLLMETGGPFRYTDALFLGRVSADAPRDLFFVEFRVGSGGSILSYRNLRNLTRTSSADEQQLVLVGESHVAYASYVTGRFDAVTLIDHRGESPTLTDDWPRRAKVQNSITNFQDSGRREGFGRIRYSLREPVETLELRSDETLVVAMGDVVLEIDPSDGTPTRGEELIEVQALERGVPGTLTWVVDSVRDLSFVGPEPIAWLEHRVFAIKDALQRGYYSVVGGPDTEAEVADELGITDMSVEATRRRAELAVTDPELGWPPATLTPVVRRPARGEGEWVAVVDDPYVRSYPNAPPAFYTTFLQVDPDRPFTRVYVVIWDPRALQFRVMTGTREPESATGATGSGMVPRDPGTLSRVVAGFNGGFQSMHGEFGMMSEGRVYLPPKPWAATVAVHRDGRVSMGSWTDPPEGVRHYREAWAVQQIPEDMVEFRQNLTSVIEGDEINPWRRWFWGAAPQGDDEQAYIDRSGICLTEEGFMAYFWGKSMGADELGEAMKATRCDRGVHLDMNQRHTAFEFYNVMPTEELPELERRPTADFEFQVDVPRARGWTARGRLLARSMTPMRFPRYIRQDPRDFFYLTQRPLLPGPDLEVEGEALAFDTTGLPHAGWPHAFARAKVGDTYLVRIDPSRAIAAPLVDAESTVTPTTLAYLTEAGAALTGTLTLYAETLLIGRRYGIGQAPQDARVILAGDSIQASHAAGIGVDRDGFLVYGEGPDVQALLATATVGPVIGLPETIRLAFVVDEQTAGPDAYERDVDVATSLGFIAQERPASEVLFPEVQPRPYMYWGRMQDTRVRYVRGEGSPRFTAPDPEDTDTP
ncbi:MAG: hypothetical protein ACI9KE_004656 [Polyangiales bacterium]|jgi:hypothetical protein